MEIFYLTSHRKKIIWSNLFKSFKDTISKTNTCFRQHHDFFKENFSKDSVTVIKTHQSHHKTKFLVICNNPRIASTKTQSIFCNKNAFGERQNSEKTNIFMISKSRYSSFLETKICFKTLNLWRTKGHEISQKIVKKEVTGH